MATNFSLVVLSAALIGLSFAAETPVPTTGLVLWLSADKCDVKDGSVTRIEDKSSHDNHAIHDTDPKNVAANPSIEKDAVSGQPVLRFSGAYSSYTFNEIADMRTIFWVVSKDAKAFKQKSERFVFGASKSLDFHPGTHFTDTLLHATPQYGSPALQKGKAWLNGKTIDPRATDFPQSLSVITLLPTGNVKANQIAKDRQFPDRCWFGDIAEILVYNVALSDADRETVEKYLMGKYKIEVKP